MHSRLIPSNLDVAESSRPIAIACPGQPKEMLMSVEGKKANKSALPGNELVAAQLGLIGFAPVAPPLCRTLNGAQSCEQPTLFRLSFLLTISDSLTKDRLLCVRFLLFLCLF
jgi:hypothetical protein